MSSILDNDALAAGPQRSDTAERPAIVLVAFGASNAEARKVFDHIAAAAERRYPEHDVRFAFTSQFILTKLKRQGVDVRGLPEVIDDLRRAGRKTVVLQSFHVAPGQEFEEIRKVDTSGLRIAVGKALLSDEKDIKAVITALAEKLEKTGPNVVVCHGNDRYPEFNRQIVAFAETFESQFDNVSVCSIEGQPGQEKLALARRRAAEVGTVRFVPLMVVAGVHVMDDVLGDQAESWKNLVGAKETSCASPLGYNDKVLAVYFRHLDEAIEQLKLQTEVEGR